MELLKSYLDLGVLLLLGAMSCIALACAIERWLFYRRIDLDAYPRLEGLQIALTAQLTTLASIASTAPYVGLLGTVLGILVTFHALGSGQSFDTAAVMLGLAMALKATALGLLVAIPSLLLYNGLLRRVEELSSAWQLSREARR